MKPISVMGSHGSSNPVQASDRLVIYGLAKLDKVALGVAGGSLVGLTVFIATIILLLKGGEVVGPNLVLLGQYFIGYSVTVTGSLIGLVYGFVTGFALGWVAAFLRNLFIWISIHFVKLKAEMVSIGHFMDDM